VLVEGCAVRGERNIGPLLQEIIQIGSCAGATVTWSSYNTPTTINQSGGNSSTFYYGADRQQYRQVSVEAGVTEDRVTIGGGAFEKLIRGSTIEYRLSTVRQFSPAVAIQISPPG
jgi:hypothetical protein